ncbi:unnamed protein product [Calypogeia fissa]
MSSLVTSLNLRSPYVDSAFCISGRSSNCCRISRGFRSPAPLLRVRCSSDVGNGDGDGVPAVPSKKGFGISGNKAAGGGSKRKEKGGGGGGGGEKVVLVGRGKNPSEKGPAGSSVRLNKVVDIVDKKSSGRSSIDPAQAKFGKVDFVRVQNWGSDGEDSPKLEDLKVKSFSPAATSAQNNKDGPFYEKLVNRLQLLESKGEIAVAQAKPLPTFDRWAFREMRYVQFLVDELSVFEALRDTIGAIRKERCRAVAEKLEEVVPFGGAASALGLFEAELGLDRCEALSADITAILSSSGSEVLTANTQAVGYAKYIRQLGKASLEDGERAKEACLKLLAHLFAVYVSHLTTGMRIGAKALDNVVSLRQIKAVRFYRDYPQEVKDPLKLFMTTINSAGSYITLDDDHEQVMEELAKAFQRTSLLLSTLAVEEPALVAQE